MSRNPGFERPGLEEALGHHDLKAPALHAGRVRHQGDQDPVLGLGQHTQDQAGPHLGRDAQIRQPHLTAGGLARAASSAS